MKNKDRFERNSNTYWAAFLTFSVAGLGLFFGANYLSGEISYWLFTFMFLGIISYPFYAVAFPDKLFSKRGGIFFFLGLVTIALVCIFLVDPLNTVVASMFYLTGFSFVGYLFWEWQLREHSPEIGESTGHQNKEFILQKLFKKSAKKIKR